MLKKNEPIDIGLNDTNAKVSKLLCPENMKQNHAIYCELLGVILYSTSLLAADVQSTQSRGNLVWDSETKATSVDTGEAEAHLTFNFTNVSLSNVTITNVHPSCGCTTAQLPPLPWMIAPGTNGQIGITVNVGGKSGTLFKSVTVDTDKGSKVLSVKIAILPPIMSAASTTNKSPTYRYHQKDMALLLHSPPSKLLIYLLHPPCLIPTVHEVFKWLRLTGRPCSRVIAPVVMPRQPKANPARSFTIWFAAFVMKAQIAPRWFPICIILRCRRALISWKTWITLGKTNSFMPAFAKKEGGPLTKSQITSIAKYLATAIPSGTNQFQ